MSRGRQNRTSRPVRRRSCALMAEGLEARQLLAVFDVTTVADTGAGSLRDAINQANSTPGQDVIRFVIGTGQKTINLSSALPALTDPVVLDGTTQPGYDPNSPRPLIEINGANAGGGSIGLDFNLGSTGSVVQALAINRFGTGINARDSRILVQGNFVGLGLDGSTDAGNQTGIQISNTSNVTIGGTTPAARNIISGNNGPGIAVGTLGNDPVSGNLIIGNYIGTDFAGQTAVPNDGSGISVNVSSRLTIGGTTPGSGNVISGNGGSGITFFSVLNSRNLIQGNLIGVNASGDRAIPNVGHGIFGIGNGSTIGGTTAAARNIISGNLARVGTVSSLAAVFFQGNISENNVELGNLVQGNYIGTDITGANAIPNTGSNVKLFSNRNTVGGTAQGAGNIIANSLADVFGQGAGVTVLGGSTRNSILGNSIFGNATLGIDLGDNGQVLPNDSMDADGGANNGQNYPVLTSIAAGGGVTVLRGTLNSTPGRAFTIQFFRNVFADASGFGEGQTYVGQLQNVLTDSSGNASFELILNSELAGTEFVSATATDQVTGDTSEFSRTVPVTLLPAANLSISQSANPNPVFVGQPITYTLTVQNPGPQNASNLRIIDTLPAGAQFVSATGGVSPINGVLTFNLPGLAVGDSASFNVTVRPTFVGTAVNRARVESDTIDPAPQDNQVDLAAQVIPSPGQSILSFSALNYAAAEADGTAQVTIIRGNGTSAVSVRLTANPGTATANVDYKPLDLVVPFAEGELVKTVSIQLIDDFDVEADETVNLVLSAPTGGAVLAQPFTSTLTILNDDPNPPAAGRIRFGSATFSVSEGQPVLSIPIERTGGSTGEISAQFDTLDGTATAGQDYEPQSYRIFFSDGDSAPKIIQLRITNDFLDEPNETVNLRLSSPQGTSLGGPSSAVVTILDDDPTPAPPEQQLITLSSPTYAVSENAGVATITVIRDSAVGSVVVNLTTSDGTARENVRYLPVATTLVFSPGEIAKTVDIPIINTSLREGDETVNITLTLPVGGSNLGTPNTAVLTIIDDEPLPPQPPPTPGVIVFSSARYLVEEGAGVARFNLVRTGGTLGAVSVEVATNSGTAIPGVDYTPIRTRVNFADGQSLAELTVPILDDTLVEGSEFIGLFLENVQGGASIGALNSAVLEIADDDVDLTPPTVANASLGGSGAITSISLAFSEPMNLDSVLNSANYQLVNVGRDGGLGTADDRLLPIGSVSYDAASQRVTISPGSTLNPQTTYALTALSGQPGQLADAFGNPLDGDANGAAGGNYSILFSRAPRHVYNDSDGDQVQLAMNGGGSIELIRNASGDAQVVRVLNPRPGRSILLGSVRRGRSGDGLAQIGQLIGIDEFGIVRSRLTTPPFIIGSVSPAGVDALLSTNTRLARRPRGR